jgi:hypothetical protein
MVAILSGAMRKNFTLPRPLDNNSQHLNRLEIWSSYNECPAQLVSMVSRLLTRYRLCLLDQNIMHHNAGLAELRGQCYL